MQQEQAQDGQVRAEEDEEQPELEQQHELEPEENNLNEMDLAIENIDNAIVIYKKQLD